MAMTASRRRGDYRQARPRRHPRRIAAWLCLAAGLAAARPAAAWDGTFGAWQLHWDSALTATAAFRLTPRNMALLYDANENDGDAAFAPGPISQRLDLASELHLARGDFGLTLGGFGWYDAAYTGTNDARFNDTANAVSVPPDHFPRGTARLHGRHAELGRASLEQAFDLGGTRISLVAGRTTLIWGESLFFPQNGVAAGLGPVDLIRAAGNPLLRAADLYLPVAQLAVTATRGPLSLQGTWQPEWRENRLPGVGSYFSTEDYSDTGGERLFLPDGAYATRTRDSRPSGLGQGGLSLRWQGERFDAGLYAVRFDAKQPQVKLVPPFVLGPDAVLPGYALVYARGIEIYGASLSLPAGQGFVAAEISARRHMPLPSQPGLPLPGQIAFAEGDTLHASVSTLGGLAPGRFWDEATLGAELAANRIIAVTGGAQAFDRGSGRTALAAQAYFVPQYLRVAPGLDLSVPLAVGLGMSGRSGVGGLPREGAGEVTAGVTLTWRREWQAAVLYTHFIGAPSAQNYADRDFVSVSVQRSF